MQTEGSSILIKGGCILTEWWAAGVVLDTFVFETCIDVSPTILLCGCAGISRWHWPTSPSTVLVSTSFASRCVFHPLYYVTFNIPQHCCRLLLHVQLLRILKASDTQNRNGVENSYVSCRLCHFLASPFGAECKNASGTKNLVSVIGRHWKICVVKHLLNRWLQLTGNWM